LPWEIGETLSAAFEGFKRSWGVLFGTFFVTALISGVPTQLPVILVVAHVVEQNSAEYWTVYGITMLVTMVIQLLFQGGLIKVWLAVARGQDPSFGELFSGVGRFFPLLGAGFITLFLVLLGYVFLFIPGIIIALGLMLTQFFVVDQTMGPIEAMKASWRATKGHKWKLFGLTFLASIIAMLGIFACCIGVYATVPILWLSLATVYLRLTGHAGGSGNMNIGGYGGGYGQAPPGPMTGGYGGPPPPAGGYGVPPGY
jgi:uncharacterized membrane protein